jgi:hypothetical protein
MAKKNTPPKAKAKESKPETLTTYKIVGTLITIGDKVKGAGEEIRSDFPGLTPAGIKRFLDAGVIEFVSSVTK